MKKKNFKLGLFGKKYVDEIYTVDKFSTGETNYSSGTEKRLGGIYNIGRLNIKSTETVIVEEGSVYALIINETKKSKRSSILSYPQSYKVDYNSLLRLNSCDWIHIAYIDDVDYCGTNVETFVNLHKIPISLDFCTLNERSDYSHLIDSSALVFDSRERKNLYKYVKSKTPIILHDEKGCECIIEGKKTAESSITPIKNLKVNGAGDIFCAFFLNEFRKNGINKAVENTCLKTTILLDNLS